MFHMIVSKRNKKEKLFEDKVDAILINMNNLDLIQQIKNNFENCINEFIKPKVEFEMIDFSVDDDGEDYNWIKPILELSW